MASHTSKLLVTVFLVVSSTLGLEDFKPSCWDNSTIYVYSPTDIARWYYQFRDSLKQSLKALAVRAVLASEPKDLESAHENDVCIVLANTHHESADWAVIKPILLKKKMKTILYETEPANPAIRRLLSWNPCAVWSYSWANVLSARRAIGKQTQVSYIPPGYSQAVDYRRSSARGATRTDEVVAIVSDGARDRLGGLFKAIPGLKNHNRVWSHREYAKQIASRHVAVNVHKAFDAARSNLELFRLAPMLSSGMRVISENSSFQDEESLEGLVTFARREDFPKWTEKYLEEARNEEVRRAVADRISLGFSQRFNLTRYLEIELLIRS
mmetsp:Transcript_6674/g.15295  ORF Transcript_6674/g.15295 Transcript_6674/m.15295 type:complete len:326 (-) Transcript_6674:121-1098(-)|eukprot:CAMPEP_0172596548 /NCGR_PEP_ID=MMETSP1068-20121228/16374_1 /TAXON_ID=35684 /ORGANISM="Pseudopedinella elastica, Strain CCMP716" /LENGTH=325 /DNA_ID=CAMNT_0013395645 /DNA_START=69 /DNA_END=1046 /DNA_ORIENTATION=-